MRVMACRPTPSSAILEDHNGNLWISTAGGLSRFDPRTRTFINYYETDGLTSDVFDGFPVAFQSRRGQMFFGNTRGLTSFWPDQIVEKPSIPPVVLTGLSLLNRPVAPGQGSPLAKSITFMQSLTLSHEQNMFSFEFAALSYRILHGTNIGTCWRNSTIPGFRQTPIIGWLRSRRCPRETIPCEFRARIIVACGMSRGLPCS